MGAYRGKPIQLCNFHFDESYNLERSRSREDSTYIYRYIEMHTVGVTQGQHFAGLVFWSGDSVSGSEAMGE